MMLRDVQWVTNHGGYRGHLVLLRENITFKQTLRALEV
jgi:hypothetical protein